MARFIIRFYSSDNVLRKEVSVIGRKLSNKEFAEINGKNSVESTCQRTKETYTRNKREIFKNNRRDYIK